MRAYSMDLQERVLLDSEAGMKAANVEPQLYCNSLRDIAGEQLERTQFTRRLYELLEWRQVT